MENQPDGDEIRIAMTRQQAHSFLQRLAEDDDFRSSLQQDARRTLQNEFEIVVPEGTLSANPQLPSKEDARRALEASEDSGASHPAREVLRQFVIWHGP